MKLWSFPVSFRRVAFCCIAAAVASFVLFLTLGFYQHSTALAQRPLGVRPTDSGGPLLTEQAAYDVKFYDLALRVDPEQQSIKGQLTVKALIVQPTAWFVLDLDEPLTVDSVQSIDASGMTSVLPFERRGGKIWSEFPLTKQPGETVNVQVAYGGKPRVAPRPPWVGGFVWSKTASGDPWIDVACQNDGADIWWPCKDHPSDEPDSMALHITVPQPLVCASNGKLQNVVKNNDGTQTFNWYVSTPINNYDVTLNIAPYRLLETKYKSVSGDNIPVSFYALPEDYAKAQELLPHFLEYLRFFEDHLGPYPFRADKVGIAETTYLGMEHQTITAYGNKFKNNEYGFDGLLFHELGHEWWGNLVTASDWRDFWLHEGFESYMDSLYVEHLKGEIAFKQYLGHMRAGLHNLKPVAPRDSRTTTQMYLIPPDYVSSDGDIYSKGAWVLHSLRYLIGDEAFFKALRRMAYPNPAMEKVKDGRQCHFATTDDFRHIAEEVSGKKLDWFFEVYLRQPKLPRLISEINGNTLSLRWDTAGNLPFPMPVDVQIAGKIQRVEVGSSGATVALVAGAAPVIDPDARILKAD
jgi:aminopeptidase N